MNSQSKRSRLQNLFRKFRGYEICSGNVAGMGNTSRRVSALVYKICSGNFGATKLVQEIWREEEILTLEQVLSLQNLFRKLWVNSQSKRSCQQNLFRKFDGKVAQKCRKCRKGATNVPENAGKVLQKCMKSAGKVAQK